MADSIDTSNPRYLGTDEQYKDHAYDGTAPLESNELSRVASEVKAHEADATQNKVQILPGD